MPWPARHPALWIAVGLALSVPAGVVDLWLGERLQYIGGGDEGRWQPFVAVTSLAWGLLIFAFTMRLARRRWRAGRAVGAALAAGVAAASIVVAALIGTLFVVLVGTGGD